MENKIEKLTSKLYLPALVLSLVMALIGIALLSFGGDKYLLLKVEYQAWHLYPVLILVSYVFLAPFIVPLMDYFMSSKKDVLELKAAYARVGHHYKVYSVSFACWIIALVIFHGAKKAYEDDLTIRFLEQKVCILSNMVNRTNYRCVM